MRWAVFDVDGTLTHTTGIDDSAFVRALDEVLGLRGFSTDWSTYPHATDSSLLQEISRRARGRGADAAEVEAVQARFFALLREAASVPGRIAEVPGAGALLAALRARPGWGLALASGAWAESARIKLAAARLDVRGLPAAFADDALAREDILRTSLRRAGLDPAAPRGVVYVGDGVWDARSARALGLGFVGVRVAGDHEHLRREGARVSLRDFRELEAALAALEQEGHSPTFGAEG